MFVDKQTMIRKEVHRMNNRKNVSVTNFSESILCTKTGA